MGFFLVTFKDKSVEKLVLREFSHSAAVEDLYSSKLLYLPKGLRESIIILGVIYKVSQTALTDFSGFCLIALHSLQARFALFAG